MTEPQQRSEISPPAAAKSPAIALVLWTAGQLILLAAIWTDLQLSANPSHTAAQFGTHLLLAGQFILSAALMADIASSTRLATASFAIAFPITQLAGWKCGEPVSLSLLDSAILLLWLVGLFCWMRLARTPRGPRARHLIAAALMFWIAGTPLLWYILADFAPGSTVQTLIAMTSPIMLLGRTPQLLGLVAIHTAVAGVAAIAAAVAYRRSQS